MKRNRYRDFVRKVERRTMKKLIEEIERTIVVNNLESEDIFFLLRMLLGKYEELNGY